MRTARLKDTLLQKDMFRLHQYKTGCAKNEMKGMKFRNYDIKTPNVQLTFIIMTIKMIM